jgi:hypothetical protein
MKSTRENVINTLEEKLLAAKEPKSNILAYVSALMTIGEEDFINEDADLGMNSNLSISGTNMTVYHLGASIAQQMKEDSDISPVRIFIAGILSKLNPIDKILLDMISAKLSREIPLIEDSFDENPEQIQSFLNWKKENQKDEIDSIS